MPGLEKPGNASELYLARGDEVAATRPLMTGDIFEDISIPGFSHELVKGMILTHPCSMRSDGVNYLPHLQVALVEISDPTGWSNCPRDRMPVPELFDDDFHVVRFDVVGLAATSTLLTSSRIACLDVRGVNLLHQRLVWYLTRFEVPTGNLFELYAPILEETDMHEEWVEFAVEAGRQPDEAAAEFHEWLRSDDGTGVRRQDRLKDPQARSAVRRALNTEVEGRYR